MTVSKAAMAALRWSRRCVRAVRSLSPVAVLGITAALVLGGAGVAGASNGGNFILGRHNSETRMSSLRNTNGPPLKLVAPSGAAPLTVSSSKVVKNLNAQYVDGKKVPQIAAGGDGFTPTGANWLIDDSSRVITSTGQLAAGTYYVTATALVYVASGDVGGFCYIAKGSIGSSVSFGGADGTGYVQAAETAAVKVGAGDTLQEWCYSGGNNDSYIVDAGITAVRVLFSSGTKPASGAKSSAAAPGGLIGQGK